MIDWKNVDSEYRGDTNEDGLRWFGDYNCYAPDELVHSYNVSQGENGAWHCWWVLLGPANVQITEGEEKKIEPTMSEQEYYQWLFENRRIKD